MTGRLRRHWKGLTAAAVALIVVLVVGVPYVYIHFIEGEQPAPLSLADVSNSTSDSPGDITQITSTPESPAVSTPAAGPATGSAASGTSAESAAPSTTVGSAAQDTAGLAGTWTIGEGSQAGYRVDEVLAGQQTTAVGRTDAVSGTVTTSDDAITAAEITVQVGEIASDNGQRDRQFTGRIMEASQYPTATFTLTKPISLSDLPADGSSVTLSATGDLTLHGTTHEVTVPLTIQRTDDSLAATGTVDITYADYGINNPSVGGFVSVGDGGTIEFLVVARRG